MTQTLERIQRLVHAAEVRISDHGYEELSVDGLLAREVLKGVPDAVLLEDYPAFPKGPCVLVLQKDRCDQPIHVVWGIPKGHDKPAVLVTAYRPDPDLWEDGCLRRRK